MGIKDRTGQVHGKLTLQHFVERRGNMTFWSATCECGNTLTVSIGNVRSGRTTSCGCARSDQLRARSHKHGMSRTTTYRIWSAMKHRCQINLRYVEQGITVCARWRHPRHGFENFLADMGPRPPGKTLERKNNARGYTPGNCVWATPAEQNRNTRRTRWLVYNGQRMCAADIAAQLGLTPKAFRWRLYQGWTGEKLFQPKRKPIRGLPYGRAAGD